MFNLLNQFWTNMEEYFDSYSKYPTKHWILFPGPNWYQTEQLNCCTNAPNGVWGLIEQAYLMVICIFYLGPKSRWQNSSKNMEANSVYLHCNKLNQNKTNFRTLPLCKQENFIAVKLGTLNDYSRSYFPNLRLGPIIVHIWTIQLTIWFIKNLFWSHSFSFVHV